MYTFSLALCPDLYDPANGMVTITGNSAWDTAIYTCDVDYELIGSMTVSCTSDGTWSDGLPTCRRKQFPLHINTSYSIMQHVTSLSIYYSSMS